MFKYYFEKVENVEIFPIISLGIFFIFFLVLLVWVFRADKSYIEEMKNMPLEGNPEDESKHTIP